MRSQRPGVASDRASQAGEFLAGPGALDSGCLALTWRGTGGLDASARD